jgi:multiple antibiotic resistance protein
MDTIKPLITLLAIVNPIGVIPFFIHFTAGQSPQVRARVARVSALTAFLVISVAALTGLQIIEFFGITLGSFQVGGGFMLLTSAISMLNAQPAESRVAQDELTASELHHSIAVVPLTIPLLTGPATISTVVIYAQKAHGPAHMLTLIGYGLVVALFTWLAFSAADRIGKILGKTGINVMTRLMGLILASLAVEVMADGLTKLFPALGHPL